MRAAGSRATALATLLIMTMPSLLPACVQATPEAKKMYRYPMYRYPRIGCADRERPWSRLWQAAAGTPAGTCETPPTGREAHLSRPRAERALGDDGDARRRSIPVPDCRHVAGERSSCAVPLVKIASPPQSLIALLHSFGDEAAGRAGRAEIRLRRLRRLRRYSGGPPHSRGLSD